MKTPSITQQDLWLLKTILRAGRITLAEINQLWLDSEWSDGVEFSRSTFIRHRRAIESIFEIIIGCDRKDDFCYYIENPEDLQTANIQNWMINSLSASSLLKEYKDIRDQVLIEDICGQEYLEKILQAIRNRQMLHLSYVRFGKGESSTIDVEPYCVKLHHQRWYVIVRNPKSKHDNLTTYALDRIKQLEIIADSHFYLPKDFSAGEFFKNFFGVFVNAEIQPERIVIRAFGTQADYFRTLSLHPSQKELSSFSNGTETFTDFEYNLSVTPDFVNELLSKSDKIEVLQPASLRKKMQEQIAKMTIRYQDN